MKKIRLALLVFLCAGFASPLFAENPWQLKKDHDGIKVYTRKVEGSPILEFKSVMTVDVPRDKAVDFYLDGSKYTQWFYQCKEARVLETRPEGNVYYYVMGMPWPVFDRDSVYLARMMSDKGDVIFRLSSLDGVYPPQPGKVRVGYLKIEWRFKSVLGGKTEITFQQHSSADGHIPVPIVNALSINMPFKTFQKMKELLQGVEP